VYDFFTERRNMMKYGKKEREVEITLSDDTGSDQIQ
jgi:hypothetical protein